MAEKKPATRAPQKSTRGTTPSPKKAGGFTAQERAAMKARAQEMKAEERASRNRAEGEKDLLAAIAAMKGSDRTMAKRVHAIVQASAPDLWAKTWYGMPAYARDGKVVCYFQNADKFNARYATFGFTDQANIDQDALWPVAFALKQLTPAAEAKIAELVKKAVS